MEMVFTAVFRATNLYFLYQVCYFFKLTQELRDEVSRKNQKIWDLEDALRNKND